MLNFYEKFDFGAIFGFRDFQKCTSWETVSRKRSKKGFPGKYADCPGNDLAFHETIVITVSLGPSVFFNFIFSMEIGYCSFCSVFSCAMFYMPLLFYLLKPQSTPSR